MPSNRNTDNRLTAPVNNASAYKATVAMLLVLLILIVPAVPALSGNKAKDRKPSKEARKALRQARRLLPSPDKTADARKLVNEALKDSILASDAETYYVAGKIEANAYAESMKKLSINRNDPKVDRTAMADALLSARSYFIRTISLDTTVDSKGNVRTHYSDQLYDWLAAHTPQYYNSGIAYLNKKQYYPQAYSAFMAYAASPDEPWHDRITPIPSDSARAKAYFYAGVMAFNASRFDISAEAFDMARRYRYPRKEVLVNQMVCYRKMADADSAFMPKAMTRITSIAGEGVRRFGISDPLFIQKYVAGKIWMGEPADAVTMIDSVLHADSASVSMLLTLRGQAHFAMKDTTAAIDDYTLAADSSASFSTLLGASKLYAAQGIKELNKVSGNSRATRKATRRIGDKWLRPALEYAIRAKELAVRRKPSDGDFSGESDETLLSDLENTIATIQYYLLK